MNTIINSEIMAIAPAKIGKRLIEVLLEKLSHIAITDKGIIRLRYLWFSDGGQFPMQLLVGGGVSTVRQCSLWSVRSLTGLLSTWHFECHVTVWKCDSFVPAGGTVGRMAHDKILKQKFGGRVTGCHLGV